VERAGGHAVLDDRLEQVDDLEPLLGDGPLVRLVWAPVLPRNPFTSAG
jgi:hypothetical protein